MKPLDDKGDMGNPKEDVVNQHDGLRSTLLLVQRTAL